MDNVGRVFDVFIDMSFRLEGSDGSGKHMLMIGPSKRTEKQKQNTKKKDAENRQEQHEAKKEEEETQREQFRQEQQQGQESGQYKGGRNDSEEEGEVKVEEVEEEKEESEEEEEEDEEETDASDEEEEETDASDEEEEGTDASDEEEEGTDTSDEEEEETDTSDEEEHGEEKKNYYNYETSEETEKDEIEESGADEEVEKIEEVEENNYGNEINEQTEEGGPHYARVGKTSYHHNYVEKGYIKDGDGIGKQIEGANWGKEEEREEEKEEEEEEEERKNVEIYGSKKEEYEENYGNKEEHDANDGSEEEEEEGGEEEEEEEAEEEEDEEDEDEEEEDEEEEVDEEEEEEEEEEEGEEEEEEEEEDDYYYEEDDDDDDYEYYNISEEYDDAKGGGSASERKKKEQSKEREKEEQEDDEEEEEEEEEEGDMETSTKIKTPSENLLALQDDDSSMDSGWTGSVLIYEEYSLSGLYICEKPYVLENDKNYDNLINVLIKSTDTHHKCEWIDYFYNKKENSQEVNILKPGKTKEEYVYREYRKPESLKNVCIFRRSSSCIFKTAEIETVDVKAVREAKIPRYSLKTMQMAGFYLSHTLYVRAMVFHKNYGNSDHLMTLVMRHYKDPFFKEPLFSDRVLVQLKSNFTSRKYAKIKYMNIIRFAQMLKPYLSLRKIDETIVEGQKMNWGFYK